jgi:DNA-nicking Smr family endonuclease
LKLKPYRHAHEPDPDFRSALGDVTPLPPRNKAALDKPRPKPRRLPREIQEHAADDLSDHVPLPCEPGEPLGFSRPGVRRQSLRHLRRGGSAIEDELDLHGLTVAQARPLLAAFLNASARRGLRHVRVIHGKGRSSEGGEGVLRRMVAGWLSQRPDVLAFHEARAADGGSGAVVVLLKGMRAEG